MIQLSMVSQKPFTFEWHRYHERLGAWIACALLLVLFGMNTVHAEEKGKKVGHPETKSMNAEHAKDKKAVEMPTQSDDTYIIGIDDTVSVSVWRNSDLSLTVPVRPDGRISTPLVGDVVAAGKTPMKLAADIEKALSVYIREPNVSVIIVGLASYEYLSRVRITGAVRSPVSLPHRKGMTVLDLVLAAGGPNDFAAPNRTILYRTNKKGEPKRISIKLDHLLKKGDIEANILLQPGDILTVPESLF